jgi:Tol biopolymer transport system component
VQRTCRILLAVLIGGGVLSAQFNSVAEARPRKILFAKGTYLEPRGLFVVDPSGGDSKRVSGRDPDSEREDYEPTWSYGGRFFAYHSDGVRVSRADGSNDHVVSQGSFLCDCDPSWAPNGNRLTYHHAFAENAGIFVVKRDGSNRRLLDRGQGLSSPVWSPEGDKILYWASGDLRVIEPDGENEEVVVNARRKTHISDFVWSNNGQKIVYSRRLFEGGEAVGTDIFIVDASSGERTRLSRSQGHDTNAAWSPDGNKIAFVRRFEGQAEVYTMRPNGNAVHKLTHAGPHNTQPVWSPGGGKIAFISDRDGDDELFLMRQDGSHEHRLTRNGIKDSEPAWAPGGGSGL